MQLSSAEARRIALGAQGFARPRPDATPDRRHFRRLFRELQLLQLDYVNVLMPAHFLVPWSRLGAYERARFADYVYECGECTEQWAHEASVVSIDSWPLLEHRRRDYRMHKNNPLRRIRNRTAYLDAVLAQVDRDGPVTAQDLPPMPGPKRKPGDWHRSIPRWALEFHFATGSLAVARRLPNFQRVFDLAERVIPHAQRAVTLDKADAQRELLRRAATALGIATLQDLADYYRMSPRDALPLIEELVEAGALAPVRVEGWRDPAYVASGARIPRSIDGASLLSPFDPLLWFRPRALRLFDFHYRIEIYVPAAQRKWGYYVLPFRVADRIVARVDLKADRQNRKLRVCAVHAETASGQQQCLELLTLELHALREWLGLQAIDVRRHNAFSRRLAATLRGTTQG